MFEKERLGSHPLTPHELRTIIHNQNLSDKRLIALNSAPLHSRLEIDIDVISGEILAKIPNELRREREDEVRETVNRNYQELHFTRSYKVDIIVYFTCKMLEAYLPKDFLEEREDSRFRGFKIVLRNHLRRRYGDWKPQRSRDKYALAIFDFEAWQHVLTINFSLDDKYPLPLFERAKEAVGYALFDKAKELGLDKKNGFFLALTVYSIKKLGEVDGCRYLKTEEEIIRAFDVPRSTFKLRMTELYKIG